MTVQHDARAEHQVLFFRGEHHLGDDHQIAFAEHNDVALVDRVPAISVLRGVTLPAYGGTTSWAHTVTAYESLPGPLKALVENP